MITTLISFIFGINAIVKCEYGYYIDIKTNYYKIYEPIEKISKNYFQFDCNE